MKCIYSEFDTKNPTDRCNMEADYVYLGKSYCALHMEIRAEEQRKKHWHDDTITKMLIVNTI